jgi:hypothetical protein
VAARTGFAVFAIRFYEPHGLVTPIKNASGFVAMTGPTSANLVLL